MNFDEMMMAHQLPHGEPYVIPFAFCTPDKDEQAKIDANSAKYHDDIMRLKRDGELMNAGEIGEEMVFATWNQIYRLMFDKLLMDGERMTLCIYTEDGIKKFDMHEGMWWLNHFIREKFGYKGYFHRKERT